tara:strand:- start:101 stop:754 length:654 start_codon:yes stop_codon:yes gene_type:complete
MNRFSNLIILCTLFLYSCVNGSIYSELSNNLKFLFFDPQDISTEKINSIPYASMQARLGRGNNTLLILEEDQEGILKWTSSNLIKVYTQNGYIIKFKGLDNELEYLELDKDHPINQDNFDIKKDSFTSFYTFNNPKLFRLPVKTKINYLGKEKVQILETTYEARLYEEISLKNLISWEFRNLYWIDISGNVIKSVQKFTPLNPEIKLKITKKYKKPD